jgi:hypothetical protein
MVLLIGVVLVVVACACVALAQSRVDEVRSVCGDSLWGVVLTHAVLYATVIFLPCFPVFVVLALFITGCIYVQPIGKIGVASALHSSACMEAMTAHVAMGPLQHWAYLFFALDGFTFFVLCIICCSLPRSNHP